MKKKSNKTGYRKASRYELIRLLGAVSSLIWTVVLLVLLMISGLSNAMAQVSYRYSDFWWQAVVLYFVQFSIFFFILQEPLRWFLSYRIEKKYELSNLSLLGWIRDDLKKQGLTFCFALLLVVCLYGLIRVFDSNWWISAWVVWVIISIFMGKILPVFIVPLFYKYEKIQDQELRQRLRLLVEKFNLKLEDVYSLNLSKTTKKANAMFCGMGSTKRVVLTDNLLDQFDYEEIDSVVAHEVGHYVKKHLLKGLVLSGMESLIVFYSIFYLFDLLNTSLQIQTIAGVDSLPLICLIAMVAGFLISPLQKVMSRHMEREADAFSLSLIGKREAFIRAMQKLGEINLANPSPNPIVEFMFYSHPSISKRIRFAQRWST